MQRGWQGSTSRGECPRPNLFLGVEVDGHDETVETQDFGENEDEDHSDIEAGLLCRSSYSSVT